MHEPAPGNIVWLIDDDDMICERVRRNLQGTIWSFEYFADAENALSLMSSSPVPSVVIADMNMPGLDGIQVLTEILEKWPETGPHCYLCSEIAPIGRNLERLTTSGIEFRSKDTLSDKTRLMDLLESRSSSASGMRAN